MRRIVASLLACTVLAGCVYAPPPGTAYVPGYGYLPNGTVITTAGVNQPAVDGTGQIQSAPLAPPGAPVQLEGTGTVLATAVPQPVYVDPYGYGGVDYGAAAVTGLAVGALTGAAIASTCCWGGGWGWGGYRGWGGGYRGWGGPPPRGGWGGGWGGGWRGGGGGWRR